MKSQSSLSFLLFFYFVYTVKIYDGNQYSKVNLIYLETDIGSTKKLAHINFFQFTPNWFSLPPSKQSRYRPGVAQSFPGS